MDVTYNVLEGTRQYFLGVPKHAQPDSTPEEGAPAQSGAPAPSSRPPSAAAAPAPTNPSTMNTLPTTAPPRPPSEPLEPEPHIIHKATVMREAAEKRREQPEPDDDEENADALSPPSHIIRGPSLRAQPSPAPAPAAPCPSPARPTPELPQPPPMAPEAHPEANPQYRSPMQRGPVPISRPPDPFAPSRPPDPYSPSRPPESFPRYHYDMNIHETGRNSHGPPVTSSRPSAQPRYNPHQTYARLTNSHGLPQHAASRLRETASHSPPTQRYMMSSIQPPPPHNDRVPPIHHPAVPAPQSLNSVDSRSSQLYTHLPRSREKSPYDPTSYYDRPNSVTERKYDHQQSYSTYRQTLPVTQPIHTRFDQQKHAALDVMAAHYATKPSDRASAPPHSQQLDASRMTRNVENRHTYFYPAPSTSSVYGPSASGSVPVPQNQSMQMRTTHRPVAPKNNYKLSPVRTASKPGVINQQTRPKVSVTSLVNEINQNKQKRESPLDLSVKTVKNSADSSTTQDDYITDTASIENKSLKFLPRTLSSSRQTLPQATMSSHKVDFLPDFTQFNERSSNQSYNAPTQTSTTACHNGTCEAPRLELPFSTEPQHQVYHDRNKFSRQVRPDYVSRINIARSTGNDRHQTSRIRDDRNFIIEERKRAPSSIISHIPEKMVRYETWVSDGRIDRLSRLAREQNELISKPVYNYASYKHLETYQIEQKRGVQQNAYNENVSSANRRYPPYPIERPPRTSGDYHQYHDRNSSSTYNRNVIQKTSTHRDVNPHHVEVHDGVPADKRVLSILRNSLETKQTGFIEPVKSSKQMPDLIVIDDVDDSVIEITDDNEIENQSKSTSEPLQNQMISTLNHNIQMPKAIDSIPRDTEINNFDSVDSKSKSPESDVASRIRTKAELKVMPPSQDNPVRNETSRELQTDNDKVKLLPKSQKQHLFNQIREDNLRMESFIKTEKPCDVISEVKSEPMNIDEIEKDAEVPLTTEGILESLEPKLLHKPEPQEKLSIDMDWDDACDSFMEQLKVGNHNKIVHKKRNDTLDIEAEIKVETQEKTKAVVVSAADNSNIDFDCPIVIKQEPLNDDITESKPESTPLTIKDKLDTVKLEIKNDKKYKGDGDNAKIKHLQSKNKSKSSKANYNALKKDEPIKTVIKEESESTDDDEPLIKSKILKEKEHSDRLKHQLLKDLSEKSAYVKLECFDIDIKNTRQSTESTSKEMDEKPSKSKISRQVSRNKTKTLSVESNRNEKERSDSSSDSEDDVSVASRLRTRKNIKIDENKTTNQKSIKTSPLKKLDSSSCSTNTTPIRKQGFGENSYFRPGWEEELYKYKRSLRMPTRLIAIPRCSSVRPFVRGSGALFSRGSTSLPDLDPAPLSPAPSSAPSAATDDLFARRPDKLTLDSDLDSNSSCSVVNKLHYDSEASTSTVVSTSRVKKKGSSIVDLLMQKCGKKEESRKKSKDNKEEKTSKIFTNNPNVIELLPTPSLEFTKNNNRKSMNNKKKKVLEDMLNLTTFRKQRASIKEVFGDERPASAPPSSHRGEDSTASPVKVAEIKPKVKSKKVIKGNKLHRRSSSTREGLRSDIIKRNDSKGRLLRLKKRNNVIKSLANKRIKESKIEKSSTPIEGSTSTQESCSIPAPETITKRRFKRLFGKRKLSSGFDYIRKKKKIIRTENNNKKITRRPAIKPSPESVHDIQKEIKGWIINKSIGETYLHRAVRSGYTDCVAYCLEKMGADPSARDNAGYTPLHVAAAKGHVRIARLLLQYGADVSAAAHAGGIRPLHEACENCHVELIRLLLAYGADPLLMTYADQTPEDLAEGPAALLLRLHIADVQGTAVEPWRFPPITEIIDRDELGCDPLSSPPPASPPPPPDSTIEIQCTEAPLPPFYSLRPAPGQPSDGLWCLLQDITNLLQIKSKDSLLKQIHCGSGSPKELLREIRTQEFLERAQCHQLLCAGEKVNVRASKVALVRVTDKLRQLLKVETILVS